MKKLLAMVVAAAVTVSTGLTSAFAASTNAVYELNFDTMEMEPDDALITVKELDVGKAALSVQVSDGNVATFHNTGKLFPADDDVKIAAAFTGAEAEIRSSGTLFTIKLTAKQLPPADPNLGKVLNATVYPAGKIPFTLTSAALTPVATSAVPDANLEFAYTKNTLTTPPVLAAPGSGGTYEENTNKTIDIEQVLYCNSSGQAVPLVENKEDLNGEGDGVRSGTDVYFLVNAPFDNENYFKLRATKGNNSKNINKIEVISKYYSKELYSVFGGKQLTGGLTTGRHTFVRVPLKELFTEDEYKITFDLKVSLTSSGESKYPGYQETSIKADDVTAIWLKNKVAKGDGDYRVGTKGMMIQPLNNDWNEIVWYNEARDLARLHFFADSDSDTFYSKLSTKWSNEDYYSYFNGQDAYLFEFTGAPKLSSTSRADLEIYNPFEDEDGHTKIDPNSVTIYQVTNGDLTDVTSNWTYKEGDNGEMAYIMRTRFLGTYIFCEKPVELEKEEETPVPEEEPIAPPEPEPVEELTPQTPDDGGKKPANTGKYGW